MEMPTGFSAIEDRMLRVDALPAGFGDCLWIEWGSDSNRSVMLIDGGLKATAEAIRRRIRHALEERGAQHLTIRLFVITHIDRDHIDGALAFLDDPQVPVDFTEIWFNGRPQLERAKLARTDLLGVVAGANLSDLLGERYDRQWNHWSKGDAIAIADEGPLPRYQLDASASLTLLGPSLERLKSLTSAWEDVMGEFTPEVGKRADLLGDELTEEAEEPLRADLLGKAEAWPPRWSDYDNPDNTPANGSSIAFVLEAEGRRLMLCADAYAEDLLGGLERLDGIGTNQRVMFDLVKLPHHGSERNFSPELAQRIDCDRYLVSTNCRVHRHPNFATVLRILRLSDRRVRLQFNYEGDKTVCWRDRKADVVGGFADYDTEYAEPGCVWGLRNEWRERVGATQQLLREGNHWTGGVG